MELHLTPEQEAHLHQIAEHEGKTPEELISDAVLTSSFDDPVTSEILRQRVVEADCGVFIEQDEMAVRFSKDDGPLIADSLATTRC